MDITVPKLISLLIAAIYLAVGAVGGLGAELLKLLGLLVLPLAFIWFPDILASLKGPIGGARYVKPIPASFVSAAGWFLLVGVPFLVMVLSALFG